MNKYAQIGLNAVIGAAVAGLTVSLVGAQPKVAQRYALLVGGLRLGAGLVLGKPV